VSPFPSVPGLAESGVVGGRVISARRALNNVRN